MQLKKMMYTMEWTSPKERPYSQTFGTPSLLFLRVREYSKRTLLRAMSRDMANYGPDPDVFRPERFLQNQIRDPFFYVFGFGRRYVAKCLLSEVMILINFF